MSHLREKETGEKGDSVVKSFDVKILWKFERARKKDQNPKVHEMSSKTVLRTEMFAVSFKVLVLL